MFATCIFCHSALGSNETLPSFPVGKRLAYDAAKGRLWVVCARCNRWNLSPLEERWEAIEEAERGYRDTKKRVSTDNIGLARMRDGTDLVRIGAPLRPEFAAWRYGEQFRKRYKRRIAVTLGTTGVAVAIAAAVPALGGVFAMSSVFIINAAGPIRRSIEKRVPRTSIVGVDGQPLVITAEDAGRATFVLQGANKTPRMEFPHSVVGATRAWLRRLGLASFGASNFERKATLQGDAAIRALSLMLPVVNRDGAYRTEVTRAVDAIEQRNGDVTRLMHDVFTGRSGHARPVVLTRRSTGTRHRNLPPLA